MAASVGPQMDPVLSLQFAEANQKSGSAPENREVHWKIILNLGGPSNTCSCYVRRDQGILRVLVSAETTTIISGGNMFCVRSHCCGRV